MSNFHTIAHNTDYIYKGRTRQKLPVDEQNLTTEQSLDDFGKYNFVHSFHNDSECGSSSAAFSQGYNSMKKKLKIKTNKKLNRKLAQEFENEECLTIQQ